MTDFSNVYQKTFVESLSLKFDLCFHIWEALKKQTFSCCKFFSFIKLLFCHFSLSIDLSCSSFSRALFCLKHLMLFYLAFITEYFFLTLRHKQTAFEHILLLQPSIGWRKLKAQSMHCLPVASPELTEARTQ